MNAAEWTEELVHRCEICLLEHNSEATDQACRDRIAELRLGGLPEQRKEDE